MKKLITLLVILLLIATDCLAANAILSWDPPTTNADGTPLTNLAGYRLYYGTSSGNYTTTIDIGLGTCSPPNCIYEVTDLTRCNRYYFVLTAYNTNNSESNYSNEVSKATCASGLGTGTHNITIGSDNRNVILSY